MNKCGVCGVHWCDHLGILGTCKLVQEQASEIERLKAESERLHKIERDRWTGWTKALFDAKKRAEVPGEW